MGLHALCQVVVAVQMIFGSQAFTSEGHAILKRFADAEQEFTNHEIADVLHQREPNSFHRISKRDLRSMTDDNNVKRVRLDLSSGSSLHLNLKKRSLFDSDTQHFYNTERGRVKRQTPPEDCYATGNVEVDGKPDGTVFVATCDGLHGTAISNGVEYYIHPVETIQGEHKVHVLSRPASQESVVSRAGVHEMMNRSEEEPKVVLDDVYSSDEKKTRHKRDTVTSKTYKTADSFVIELAIFVDSKYRARLETLVPGREDEYLLMSTAAVQALYSNKVIVGYHIDIKVKLFMVWLVNPEGYNFKENLGSNMHSLCELTHEHYKYDIHFLHTGVTKQPNGAVAVAYSEGVCTPKRCADMYPISSSRYLYMAHEIGHSLSFRHIYQAHCPQEMKNLGGGFMDGRGHFSPCNKWELRDFFRRGKGQCLFEETAATETPEEYVDVPRVLPGQFKSPDELCRLIAGEGFEYYRPFDLRGVGECALWMCINLDKESPEYLKVLKTRSLKGFPCGEDKVCRSTTTCIRWDEPFLGLDVEYLQEQKQTATWSEWPDEWSECSNECGPGIQFQRRRCSMNNGTFLSPYCRGLPTRSRVCNNNPCNGTPDTDEEIRKARGIEICSRFYNNSVALRVGDNSKYLPNPLKIWVWGESYNYYKTKSCMLMCQRVPAQYNHVDAIYPDGTPCTETDKVKYVRDTYNIDLRCLNGVCTEVSDCPGHEEKDKCGLCGGDPAHCITKLADSTYNVPIGERSVLAVLPPGTSRIDINFKWYYNKYVRLEAWNAVGKKIFGSGGIFRGISYRGDKAVQYAGTKWEFQHAGLLRADGPIDQEIVVKALRQKDPINKIYVNYVLPHDHK